MHLAMSGLRAVETRRPWVRATNNGISAVLDAAGRVTVGLVRDGRDRNVAGALRAEVPLSGLTSLYVRIGDAFAWLMAVAGGCLVALAARRGRAQAVAEGPSRPPRRRRS
jgi:apolipoprotein N-acyltransferase